MWLKKIVILLVDGLLWSLLSCNKLQSQTPLLVTFHDLLWQDKGLTEVALVSPPCDGTVSISVLL